MSNRTFWKITLIAALCLMLLAIWRHNWSGGSSTGAKPTVMEADGYAVEVVMEQAPAIILKPNPLKISIHRLDGQPVAGAEIDYELLMPNMFCGKVAGTADPLSDRDGSYEGSAIPLMTGTWTANINIKLGGSILHVKHPFSATR
ncbi:FixH family protein [Paenibacillus sp. GCM10027628]|uniref:FixH family protein n=1 Tax=Paenibacillus sp. GCM10027628 TaxID=3273413 RepID=UPI0036411FF6